MGQWVRTDFDLGMPYKILIVRNYDLRVRDISFVSLSQAYEPNKVAGIVGDFIQDLRPDLSGGKVVSLRLDVIKQWWEVGYVHPSFDYKKEGEEPERVHLIGGNFPEVNVDLAEPNTTDETHTYTTDHTHTYSVSGVSLDSTPYEQEIERVRRDIERLREERERQERRERSRPAEHIINPADLDFLCHHYNIPLPITKGHFSSFEVDSDQLKEEMGKYMNGLQRWTILNGANAAPITDPRVIITDSATSNTTERPDGK